ncbi:YrrS family protein [Viridibacillus sp. YIM B01967]|uniref:YrrS family protein n=1 Tax=Viridibacillus soli TaxID=2798301 RepID=A0ABS1H1T7_9BACL|nr:YrrS family protein [Viridibacillus soli]MBK3493363.1 YrrS family protein [Viridibacillus soli]
MADTKRRYNPQPNRPQGKKKKMDKVLNGLIGVVVLLILVVAAMIIIGGKSDDNDSAKENITKQPETTVTQKPAEEDTEEPEEQEEPEEPVVTEEDKKDDDEDINDADETTTEENKGDSAIVDSEDKTQTNSDASSNNNSTSSEDKTNSATAEKESSKDPVVKEVIKDSNWKPTATAQKDSEGAHNSNYDKNSTDWKEKITTLSTTTGLAENDMIVWYIKNGGSPDTAIGIVSSNDKKDKYRVNMKWVKNKGWKPTKMEVLNTLTGAY